MDESWFVFSLIGIIILIITIIIILKYIKGSLEFSINEKEFIYGDIISGKVMLKAKKKIESNKLILRFSGRKVSGTGSNRSSYSIYEKEIKLESERKYHRGTYTFDFEINIPRFEELKEVSEKDKELLIKKATYINWKLETQLDSEGVDLYRSEHIKVKKINN